MKVGRTLDFIVRRAVVYPVLALGLVLSVIAEELLHFSAWGLDMEWEEE